jgi:hypothetical protein
MTTASQSPYGTTHHAYIEGLGTAEHSGIDLARHAWDIASVVEETRARDGEHVAVYFLLTDEGQTHLEKLRSYLNELGYSAEFVPREGRETGLLRVGPERRRGHKAHVRPRRLERYG